MTLYFSVKTQYWERVPPVRNSGLASAMKPVDILNIDPNTVENLSQYIKDLRISLKDLIIENQLITQKGLLPKIGHISKLFKHNQIDPKHYFFDKGNDDYLFVTITFDPKKYPQLIVTPDYQQKEYIEQILTKATANDVIASFYGVYEKQKNGNIHFHFIVQKYSSIENQNEIKDFFTPYFTDRRSKYAIDVRPVNNMEGLITDYLKKAVEGVCHNLPDDVYFDLDLNPLNIKSLETFKRLGLEKTI